jgi:hypothetical protein
LSYIDEIADAIRQAVPADALPEGDTTPLFRIYAVLAATKGDRVTLEDVHDAWAAWMSEHDPEHQSLRPLSDLPEDVRSADRPYLEAIRLIARERRLGR